MKPVRVLRILSRPQNSARAFSTKYPARGNRFEGKNIVVTGAAGNFGGIAARMLAAEGANVALVDMAVDKLPEVQKEVESYGVKAMIAGMDLTDEAKVINMVNEVKAEFKTIDGVFNNAGYQVRRRMSCLSLSISPSISPHHHVLKPVSG